MGELKRWGDQSRGSLPSPCRALISLILSVRFVLLVARQGLWAAETLPEMATRSP